MRGSNASVVDAGASHPVDPARVSGASNCKDEFCCVTAKAGPAGGTEMRAQGDLREAIWYFLDGLPCGRKLAGEIEEACRNASPKTILGDTTAEL